MTKPLYKRAAIVGAGLMGHGIAVVLALGGTHVTLCDLSEETLSNAKVQIGAALKTLSDAGDIDQEAVFDTMNRVEYTTELNIAVTQADLIIEAITENADAKKSVFQQIANVAPNNAVIASNTSYLDVFPLMPDTIRARAFIMHWYTPAYIIDLVDVVASDGVPDELAANLISYLKQLGKTPVQLKKFIPGYVANRVQMAIESEIFRLLDDGVAEPEEIDLAIREGLGLRLWLFGQFKKIDYTGLRIVRDSHNFGIYQPPSNPTVSDRLVQLVDTGKEGVSKGHGFYDYGDKNSADLFHERDLMMLRLKKSRQSET